MPRVSVTAPKGRKKTAASGVLRKTPTGIVGFDQITCGGLPSGRPTLICGATGCGKTLFAMQFLVRGVLDYGEPGVFVAFEETESDLAQNVASLGIDLDQLVRRKKLAVDHIHVERNEIEEAGEYDLEGLFVRLNLAIESVGAKRVVIDTLETIFGGLDNVGILRSELRRLFRWLKDKGVTTIVTAERGEGALTRHGLEEYVSDCVVLLDHRVYDQVSTRRVRIVKYRGSTHGTNDYPFLIDKSGITVVPITSMRLEHAVFKERVSSGIDKLDTMLSGGYFRGSTVLVSGTAGAGKSSLCAHFLNSVCATGERCLYLSFEESPEQIKRNMTSIGLDLERWTKRDLLSIEAWRPTTYGLEGHLALVHKLVQDFKPKAVVIDPIGTLNRAGSELDAHTMLVRLIDFVKASGITLMMSSLTYGGDAMEATSINVSSLVDTWLLVKTIEANGERNRGLYVLKSRGMAHSNQIREFLITNQGVQLVEPYVGAEGVLTGTARIVQENLESMAKQKRINEVERKRQVLELRRAMVEEQITKLRAEFAAEETELLHSAEEAEQLEQNYASSRKRLAELRGATQNTQRPRSRSNGNGRAVRSRA